MAWTSMHYAVGMGCAGAVAATTCLLLRRGWRWLPAAMTVGGLWGLAPDLPRFWREDFPWLPAASVLGRKSLEKSLHSFGDLFFLHSSLDAQPKEYALHGLFLIILFYNLGIGMLMWMEHRQRNSIGNRAWNAHAPFLNKPQLAARPPAPGALPGAPPASRDPHNPVIHRIRSSHYTKAEGE